MRILLATSFQGYNAGCSFERALRDLGLECRAVAEDEHLYPEGRTLRSRVLGRLFGRPIGYHAYNRYLLAAAREFRPDLFLITRGAYVSPDTLRALKRDTGAFLVNYSTDDPFNRFATSDQRDGIPFYDLYVTTRTANIDDISKAGARNVVFVPFGYDPVIHFPEATVSAEEQERFASDVVFIGAADSDRAPFFERLVKELPGIRLHLYGAHWERHMRLRRFHRGNAIGRDYRLALSGTKIAPCLVRRVNRDGHVMRTFEVPACGAFMLAELTSEHQLWFEKGRDVDYFDGVDEFVTKVKIYLGEAESRRRMAVSAHHTLIAGNHSYRDRIQYTLETAARLCVPGTPALQAALNKVSPAPASDRRPSLANND
jgi:spore maturation protein CgeB